MDQDGKPTVLVVEDEQPLAKIITQKLQKRGIEVVTSRTVEQSLEYLSDVPNIKVIWLDHYLLGHEDGIDFLHKVKTADSRWRNIPVFVVSNTATADKVNTYIELGVEHYYTKSDNRLDDIVDEVCKKFDISE
ncbi:response regulator [candidate division WWE3 bacterium]|uniref:Response regulator n=1 Tax=candidate division WWE3 bacterium TaxID=2053526 RepID=A0A955LVA7_UNCKA|nr:response regulator [candidate division WWE3 bacterium]